MRQAPPSMPYQERLARSAEKRLKVCQFLAGGEVYSTSAVLSELLGLFPTGTRRLLTSMQKDKLLVSEALAPGLVVWGVTPHGLALADRCGDPHHELGRTNPAYVQHRLDRQLMRLAAERAGWTGWTTERALHLQAEALGIKLRKIPDAIATTPDGRGVVAIEIERHAKTPKRYQEVLVAYLQEIKAGRYHHVDMVCPDSVAHLVRRALDKVETVKFQGEVVRLDEKQRARFVVHAYSQWPPAAGEGAGRAAA